jgi:hypothetical protein
VTSEQMRGAREANPFRPFTLRMADGRSFRILHRDYVSVSPGGRTVIVYEANESFSILDLLLATELSVDPPAGQPAEGGAG